MAWGKDGGEVEVDSISLLATEVVVLTATAAFEFTLGTTSATDLDYLFSCGPY